MFDIQAKVIFSYARTFYSKLISQYESASSSASVWTTSFWSCLLWWISVIFLHCASLYTFNPHGYTSKFKLFNTPFEGLCYFSLPVIFLDHDELNLTIPTQCRLLRFYVMFLHRYAIFSLLRGSTISPPPYLLHLLIDSSCYCCQTSAFVVDDRIMSYNSGLLVARGWAWGRTWWRCGCLVGYDGRKG